MKTAEEINLEVNAIYETRGMSLEEGDKSVIKLLNGWRKEQSIEFACHAIVSTGKCSDTEISHIREETENLYDEFLNP